MTWLEPMPSRPEAIVLERRDLPTCGACARQLQSWAQLRCPYVSCRAWLWGTQNDAEAIKAEIEEEESR